MDIEPINPKVGLETNWSAIGKVIGVAAAVVGTAYLLYKIYDIIFGKRKNEGIASTSIAVIDNSDDAAKALAEAKTRFKLSRVGAEDFTYGTLRLSDSDSALMSVGATLPEIRYFNALGMPKDCRNNKVLADAYKVFRNKLSRDYPAIQLLYLQVPDKYITFLSDKTANDIALLNALKIDLVDLDKMISKCIDGLSNLIDSTTTDNFNAWKKEYTKVLEWVNKTVGAFSTVGIVDKVTYSTSGRLVKDVNSWLGMSSPVTAFNVRPERNLVRVVNTDAKVLDKLLTPITDNTEIRRFLYTSSQIRSMLLYKNRRQHEVLINKINEGGCSDAEKKAAQLTGHLMAVYGVLFLFVDQSLSQINTFAKLNLKLAQHTTRAAQSAA